MQTSFFNKKKLILISILFFSSNFFFSQTGPGGVGNRQGSADLNLWLDANQIETIINGNNITTWVDESGSGNNVTQNIANNKPNWHENTVNGFPSLSFDGGERLEGTFSGGLQAPVSVFTVVYFDSLNQATNNWDYVFSARRTVQP